jgi:hypothetical protein
MARKIFEKAKHETLMQLFDPAQLAAEGNAGSPLQALSADKTTPTQ